jgi:hypothetical protein
VARAHQRQGAGDGRCRAAGQAFNITLFRTFKQQLHAKTDAHQRRLQLAQRLYQPLRMQAPHALGRSTHTRQDYPLKAGEIRWLAHHLHVNLQPLQCIAHRAQVGAAGINQTDLAHKAPLVDGNSVPSLRMAWRKARAKALKQASTLW